MGSIFSSVNSPESSKPDSRPHYDGPNRYPYVRNGQLVPVEANPTIWYESLSEAADCVQHQDKDKVIIFTPICDEDNGEYPDPRSRHGWPIKRLRKAYELLGGPHPRIVRYIGALYSTSGDGIVIEKLEPGQLTRVEVPAMTVPVVAQTMSHDDKIMLSLYYRWAIQALSAFRFIHARSMCIGFFSSQLVWIRPDFSLAVGGFISASAQEIEDELWKDTEEDTKAARREANFIDENGREIESTASCGWDEGEWAADDMIYDMVHYEDPFDESYYTGGVQGSVKADLFYWATFVWRLMTNDFTAVSPSRRGPFRGLWEPAWPMEGGYKIEDSPNISNIIDERERRKLFQQLERARLGHVLVGAWNNRYGNVDEVVRDIELAAVEVGITISGDEVDIGEKWENVFEFKDEKLGFKVRPD
ncbi:uncharacterized protein J4E78_002760 [Alternaria triticimaculans]|uniref:uncharacterized protein n=1 Tax=Alternaria triticimaculans TaxID=297637 RepID=UPI0020C502DE|nr:uncharacterized protein J4E78_002760 [Alternaria triticimaculans]KAI4665300.1 hypothetical protein J4E78_002760 [Alternaria triticimaculans]